MRSMENLAPAGNRQALERADAAGADAVPGRAPAILTGRSWRTPSGMPTRGICGCT